MQAEAATEARAGLELAQSGTADGGQGLGGQEDGESLTAAADAGVETAPLDEEGEPGSEDGSAPSPLATLEDLLGFSPVVGGVGLVGLILILGGLIALMRRRRSSPEDAAEDEFASRDDEDSDLWEDDALLDDESAGAQGGDTSAPETPGEPKSARRPADDELDVDHFDIGIDLDEELARALDEEPGTDPRFARGNQALERALSPPRDGDGGGRPPAGPAVDAASTAARDRAAGPGEDSSRTFEDPSLSELIEPIPELDDGRGGVSRGPWPNLGATEPARGVRDAGAALGPGLEARDESRAGLGAAESLATDIDELQTKLDLAQTYIDMEDYDDARALLREVQAEGDLEQRAIARYLAGKLP
jgi:FimV-like protein